MTYLRLDAPQVLTYSLWTDLLRRRPPMLAFRALALVDAVRVILGETITQQWAGIALVV
jgi:hypothetical protein